MRSKLILTVTILIAMLSSAPGCQNRPVAVSGDDVGVLTFFTWNEEWNGYMYEPKDKALKAMDLLQQTGIKWARMDFPRNEIELEEKNFKFEELDWVVDELHKRGISILGILGYSPNWASSNGDYNGAPKDLAGFTAYVAATVNHFKGRVDHWEIWNEPNHKQHWVPQDNMTRYCELLKVSYTAVKSANPHAAVLLGGIAGAESSAIRAVYERGGKDYFDVMNVHFMETHTGKNIKHYLRAELEDVRKLMEQFGDKDKKIWITEIGRPGVAGDRHFSPQRQADFLQDAVTFSLHSQGVERVFWAFLQDTKLSFLQEQLYNQYGLLTWGLTPKPAYEKLKQLIELHKEK